MMEYDVATLEIFDEVFAAKDFRQTADRTICHEMLHLALYPLVAFVANMFTDEPGKIKEADRLEERVVTVLEGALTRGR